MAVIETRKVSDEAGAICGKLDKVFWEVGDTPPHRLGNGRYLTHQKASQRPLSMTRFLIMYATTRRKNERESKISRRSSQSAFSREVTRPFDVVRSIENELYKSEVIAIV